MSSVHMVLAAYCWFLEVGLKNSKSFWRSCQGQRCYKRRLEEISTDINQQGMVEDGEMSFYLNNIKTHFTSLQQLP